MSAVILLSLPLTLLVVALVLVFAVLEMSWQSSPVAAGPAVRSQFPPTRKGSTAELVATAGHMIGETGSETRALVCPDTPFMPLVTEPEAQTIAQEILGRGPAEVHRVLERSRHSEGACPMRLAGGLCACAAVRPLDCIGRCTAGCDSPEWAEGLGLTLSTAFRDHLRMHHSDATIHPLDESLSVLLTSSESKA